MYKSIGDEFKCKLSVGKVYNFDFFKILIFSSDINDDKEGRYHYFTIKIFRYKFSIWRWLTGD